MTKKNLRKHFRHIRLGLSEAEYADFSMQICECLLNTPFYQQAQTIHTFLPYLPQKEVNLYPFIQQALIDKKRVFFPIITDYEKGEMVYGELYLDDMKGTPSHLELPIYRKTPQALNFDIILVPALAVDKKGYRLGYGKGFYDRFLSTQSGLRIAPIFTACLTEELPIEKHDLPIKIICTEKTMKEVPI